MASYHSPREVLDLLLSGSHLLSSRSLVDEDVANNYSS